MRHDMVVDQTDDLHVAGGQGQGARCVTVVSFGVDIHTLCNSQKTVLKDSFCRQRQRLGDVCGVTTVSFGIEMNTLYIAARKKKKKKGCHL